MNKKLAALKGPDDKLVQLEGLASFRNFWMNLKGHVGQTMQWMENLFFLSLNIRLAKNISGLELRLNSPSSIVCKLISSNQIP